MSSCTCVRPLSPFVFFAQDVRRVCRSQSLDRPALRKAFCFWHQFDGTACLTFADTNRSIRPGDVVLTEPGATLTLGQRAHGRFVAFALFGDFYQRNESTKGYMMDESMTTQPSWYELLGVRLDPMITEDIGAAKDLIDYICGNYWLSPGHLLECNARLLLWVARHVRFLTDGEKTCDQGNPQDLSKRAQDLISTDFPRISVASLALRLGVSRQHLSGVYARTTGRTLVNEIRRKRIEIAQDLLRKPHTPIGEIAHRVGYRSATTFGHAFRVVTGFTPRQWRRQM